MKMTKRILALALALALSVFAFAACGNTEETSSNAGESSAVEQKPAEYQPIDLADVVEHEDYTSVYEMIGSKVTIDMVEEDEDTGLAYVTVDGVKYELGMDFLSGAMVYNSPDDDAFNQWWKLYIQRWNYLVPEVPLYSNQYFDLYNAKIEGFVTTPYWAAADAIVAATIKEGADNSVILGSATELSGAFRNSSWGKSSPGSSDLDIENLVTGYSTVQTDKSGNMIWNMKALAEEPVKTLNEDGSLTYTIKIKNDLKFSDGSAITAKNYIAYLLANSSEVGAAAGGTGAAGQLNVGYEEFKAYDGTNDGATVGEGDDAITVSKYFDGVKLLDDYSFSVTFLPEYANYYYVMQYAAYSPNPMALYLGSNDIIVNEETKACGLSDNFYKKVEKDGAETYAMAETIVNNLKWNSKLPYSGPYTVKNYDESALIATLELNPNYPGDDARGTASIQTITYIKVETETQMDKFLNGEVDVIAGITGAAETEAALKSVTDNPDKYAETHYDRAGYGKLAFRADLGPASFLEVRQAVMYTLNRPEFAQAFTGGYGTVVHGPYYEGYSAFQAVKSDINLNQYTYSKDNAIAVLEEGGWIYDENGNQFDAGTDAVRYKKLSGYELSKQNLEYKTVDGKYKTVKINGEYYMPLAINYYGTQPNDVTDLLITAWQSNATATTEIGAYIQYISCDFTSGLYAEYFQSEADGWDGVAKCVAINFATGFTSTIYDFYFNWTIDPELFDIYSNDYLMDEADFYENYKAE
ncbi:MAG: hypothetical protein E7595_07495 [Ruminococcaceae bacterium]|nr:hypothetical protein [Oscillospiraceae bacterium]